jgi:amino acid adenylation domain-containing protein
LLHHYTGQEDILIGSPTTGRNRSELADLIGYFVNPVVLRVDLSRNPTFDDLLKRVRHHVLAAFEHQDYPFPLLAERLQLERNVARSPRFQVMFVWQKAHLIKEQGLTAFALSQEGVQMDLGGLRIEPIMLTQQAAQFDLTLTMAEVGDGLAAALQYNTDLFDHSTVARMAGHFKVLLRDIAGTPHRHVSLLRLLTSAERHQLLLEWNDTRSGYPANSCIHQLFEEQAERTPEADALIYNGDRLSYRDLNGRANQLAHALRCLGVGSEVRVGICVEPSHEMIIGVLGILKAGGTYVPLDPISPPERLRYMLENAGAAVLLTHERLRSQLPAVGIPTICLDTAGADIARERADNLSSSAISAHLSHVIYTSGSTGRPKGVMVAHSSVVNLWAAIDQAIYAPFARRRLRGCLIAPLSFDGSIREYLLLLRGHTLIIAPQEFRRNGEALLAYLRDNAVDEFYCTPSQLQLLIAAGLLNQTEYAPALVLLGGEQIQAPLWQLLAKQQRTVYYNIYGPTECTVDSTLTRITGGPARPTIGRPLGNVESYILDRQLNPTPIGVPGELYIGGHGLARGYINDPQQTAEKFIPHPFSADAGARLYRTGDLARYLPDGNIDFLGRVDHLIKIRGFSIEPGEIEAAICAHPAVRTATVVAHGVDGAELQVVAYFVPVPDAPLTITELRAFLKEHLPYYMLPVAFVPLDSLPVTANGKVDYRALPPLDQARTALGVAYQSPGNTVEAMLAEIWGKVLGIDQIGVQDNFFDLGGSSLSIVRVRALIAQQLGVDIPIVKLFHYPTIQSLAEYILREQEPGTPHLERSRSIAARRLQRLSLRKAPGE